VRHDISLASHTRREEAEVTPPQAVLEGEDVPWPFKLHAQLEPPGVTPGTSVVGALEQARCLRKVEAVLVGPRVRPGHVDQPALGQGDGVGLGCLERQDHVEQELQLSVPHESLEWRGDVP
jgi:hypothetical protein